jgi:putative proteasome-type protease
MTYCLAIRVETGILFASDTRTNAGVDYVTSYRKLHVFRPAEDRIFTLLTAGNLATTRQLLDTIDRDLRRAPNGESLLSCQQVFEAADYLGRISVQIQDQHRKALAQSGVSGDVTLILGGQIRGSAPDLVLIYPQGNYIGTSEETPYLQIGETKYGKPILDRLAKSHLSLEAAARLALVSLDATIRSNVTVGLPFDFALYETDSLGWPLETRIEAQSTYYQNVSRTWQAGFENMFAGLTPFPVGAPR